MFRIGVLVSGGGTNLQAIIDRIESGALEGCAIAAVVSSRPDAYALTRAERHGIPAVCIARRDYPDPVSYAQALRAYFLTLDVDLIVLAGFMTILDASFIEAFRGRIINVHPSLIPSFCGKGFYGLRPHIAALEYGVKVTGATVHYVEPEVDAGPIILQKAVYVQEGDTPETLQKRVMEEAEWQILPEAIAIIKRKKEERMQRND